MSMRDQRIYQIFLLSVLGLILGIFYTEDVSSFVEPDDSEEIIIDNGNETIILYMEPQKRSSLDSLFT